MEDRFVIRKWREAKRWRRLEVPSECRMMLRKGSPLNPLPLLVLGVLLSTLRLLFPIAWLINERESQKEKRAHQNGCGLHQQLRMESSASLMKEWSALTVFTSTPPVRSWHTPGAIFPRVTEDSLSENPVDTFKSLFPGSLLGVATPPWNCFFGSWNSSILLLLFWCQDFCSSSQFFLLKIAAQEFCLGPLSFSALPEQAHPVSDFNYQLCVNLPILTSGTDFSYVKLNAEYLHLEVMHTPQINICKTHFIIFTSFNPSPPGFCETNPGILPPLFHIQIHGTAIHSDTQTRTRESSCLPYLSFRHCVSKC